MRNLEECRTEIFRLGEEKIKQRKKRRMQVFSICVPLCCCLIALCVSALFPATSKSSYSETEQMKVDNDGLIMGVTSSGTASIYLQLEIKSYGDEGYHKQIIDTDKINYLTNFIEAFYLNDMGGMTGTTDDKPNNQAGNPNIKPPEAPSYDLPDIGLPESSQTGYVISFSTENGAVVEYILLGNTLKNNNTGTSVILTDAQKNELLYELTGGV